ncbi:MAG: hypothetical protein E7415_04275 [Ruminococcaceae bacterium]|nr:hypothetical protein [Oscillospiraceae bacterium]
MKRDVCVFYNKNVEEVYRACVKVVAGHFNQEFRSMPFHAISFGLCFSFRYNMNGGLCNVSFISYNGGTAMNINYDIYLQLWGARYKAHSRHMVEYMNQLLGTYGQEVYIPIEEFMKPSNKVVQNINPYAGQNFAYANAQPNANNMPNMNTISFCSKCGRRFEPSDMFCRQCGGKRL